MFLFNSYSLMSQTSDESNKLLTGKKLIAEMIDNKISLKIKKEEFIKLINDSLFSKTPIIDDLEIKKDVTLGDEKIEFYFLRFYSNSKNINLVRWLFKDNHKLYIDKTYNSEIYTYKDFYVSCEGVDSCKPRLFFIDSFYFWGCGDFIGCVTEEEANKNKCVRIVTAF